LLKRGKTIGAELTFSDHLGGFYSRDGCGGGMKGLEAKHRAGDPLEEAMVLLQDIVQAFDLPDVDGALDAAHQIRNPVAGLVARAEAFATARPQDLPARSQSLLSSARQTGRLTNQLLNFERMQGRELRKFREQVDLRALFEAITRAFAERVLMSGMNVTFEVEGPPRSETGDPIMLAEMLENLLLNAQTHAGAQASVLVRLVFEPDRVVLVVTDDGPGLPDKLHETGTARIFDRFYSAGKGGSGLGLAIVKDVARNHAGDVNIRPSMQGLTLQIDLFNAGPP
jgi:two-component system, OmpR family, sensor histidine kinase TctE